VFKIEVSNGTKIPDIIVLNARSYRDALQEARTIRPTNEYTWKLTQGGKVLAREGERKINRHYASSSFEAKPWSLAVAPKVALAGYSVSGLRRGHGW
jgi:hypothetical protein